MGIGFEGLPFSWYSVASSDEEWAFVVSRSLYFTSDGGKSRLTAGLLTGSAANGLAKGLTFGLSALVFDAKVSVVGAVRKRYLSEADLFGLQVLDAAGMDVDKALAFAQRMSQEQALPSELTELHFSAERLLALNTEASRLKAARLVAPAH
jgi:antitoxin component of RelBE/YafQ-DinJ toxin-antitoxin module